MPIFGVASKSTSIRGFLSLLASAALLAVSFTPLLAAPAARAATLDVSSSAFSFRQTNRTMSSPTTVGGYSIYSNVATVSGITVNAKVTTVAKTGTTINDYDSDGSASSNLDAFQIDQDVTSTGGRITVKFEFYDAATTLPVVLTNMAVTSIDLDSPGRQFSEFSSFQSYVVSNNSNISAYTTDTNGTTALAGGLVRFTQTRGNSVRSSSNDPSEAVQINFAQLTSFNVTFGNESSGLGYYGVTFSTLCATATGSACTAAAAVNNPNNTAPTSSNTSLNYLNDGTTWTAVPLDRFPFADVDNNPFTQVKITTLPATGSLQQFINGTWSDVVLNDVISKDAIAAGFLRYRGTVDASLGFQVHDGLSYSTSYTLSLNARLQAQAITFNALSNKTPNFASFPSNATADSGLTVILVSETPEVCTVTGTSIFAVSGATGTCTIRATQPGDSVYAAAVSVAQSFQVTTKTDQTIALANPGDQTWSGSNFTVAPAVTPDATSNLGVTVVSLTTTVCTVAYTAPAANATVTIRSTGSCQLRATQGGNSTYAPANPVIQTFNVASAVQQQAQSYTVTFDNNGGSGSMSAQSASTATALTSNTFTRVGYTFGGWSLTQNGSLAYADGASYPFSSSTTLWAIWTANAPTSYTVTFDATDGTGSMSPQSASSAAALSANTFTRSGYTFAGWATTRNGSVAYANLASYPFTSSTTLYAVWTAIAVAPVAPTIAIPGGNTTGIAPVTLTPSIDAPSGIGSRCLVDPADGVCKQSVTLPGKGTFVLNANGSVTFTAVLGWTGTATVQYRVTSANGLSAEAPVIVVVAAPNAPTVTGGSGQTITTVPANVTPQISGIGSACLIDPADDVCKQRVFIPGKGTKVLNANGTVTFTAVAGFIGTVTVQLQVTDAYGQSARGPVTFTVGSSSQLQTGATTGTAPVVLYPNVKPDAGSACLVDPNDTDCKSVVTISDVGTWNLNPTTGSVTFRAVEGFVGTTLVQYRIKRAGFNATETPFVVTVAKKRPPVTVTIGGFKPGSPILTNAIKSQIAAFIKAYVGYRTIECIGFTMGPTVLKVDKWLSTTRASNGCNYVLNTLKSKVKALPLKNKMETVVGSQIRRVTLTLRD